MKPTDLPKIIPILSAKELRHTMARALTDLKLIANTRGGTTQLAGNLTKFLTAAQAAVTALTPAGLPATLIATDAIAAADGRSFTVTFNQAVDPDSIRGTYHAFAPASPRVFANLRGQITEGVTSTVVYPLEAPYLVTGNSLSVTYITASLPKTYDGKTCVTTGAITVNTAGVTNLVANP